jgi:hypothetical protein
LGARAYQSTFHARHQDRRVPDPDADRSSPGLMTPRNCRALSRDCEGGSQNRKRGSAARADGEGHSRKVTVAGAVAPSPHHPTRTTIVRALTKSRNPAPNPKDSEANAAEFEANTVNGLTARAMNSLGGTYRPVRNKPN